MNLPKISTGIYRHTKSDNLYEVIGVAMQTETEEALVVYRPMYESECELFARPLDMFLENVEINGTLEPRFEKVKG